MGILALTYTAIMWCIISLFPLPLISIFSSDASLTADAIPALKLYFAAFIFQRYSTSDRPSLNP